MFILSIFCILYIPLGLWVYHDSTVTQVKETNVFAQPVVSVMEAQPLDYFLWRGCYYGLECCVQPDDS